MFRRTNAGITPAPLGCECGGRFFEAAWAYTEPPEGETRFRLSRDGYRREIAHCHVCRHFVSVHEFDLAALYDADYVGSTYGADGLRAAFERIVSLPPGRSDNAGRVARVLEFAAAHALAERPTALDVGSGVCVFLHRLAQAGWQGTALDPDERAVAHARSVVGVDAVCGDYLTLDGLGRFNLVTFNKVLEHVEDPVGMLARAHENLEPGGVVYVEVPDGEAAAADGPGREEFFIEHLHVFSPASLALLAARAGFSMLALERIREPSTKYTLAAFLAAG